MEGLCHLFNSVSPLALCVADVAAETIHYNLYYSFTLYYLITINSAAATP